MKNKITINTTSKKIRLFIRNTADPQGGGLKLLNFQSNGLSGVYFRDGDTTPTNIPLASGIVGTYVPSGFVEVHTNLMPGVYEFGVPNSALSVASNTNLLFFGAANMAPVPIEIELDKFDYQVYPVNSNVIQVNGSGITLANAVPANLTSISGVPIGTTTYIQDSVWNAQANAYLLNGSMGSGVNKLFKDIYYANIKFDRDNVNNQDEFTVNWFKNENVLSSGNVSNPAISLYKTNDGTSIFQNQTLSYASINFGALRYNQTTQSSLVASGEPYLVVSSGLIDGGTRVWQNLVGLDYL